MRDPGTRGLGPCRLPAVSHPQIGPGGRPAITAWRSERRCVRRRGRGNWADQGRRGRGREEEGVVLPAAANALPGRSISSAAIRSRSWRLQAQIPGRCFRGTDASEAAPREVAGIPTLYPQGRRVGRMSRQPGGSLRTASFQRRCAGHPTRWLELSSPPRAGFVFCLRLFSPPKCGFCACFTQKRRPRYHY